MTCTQMLNSIYVRNSTAMPDLHHIALELPLTSTSQYDRFSSGFWNSGVFLYAINFMLFPLDQSYCRLYHEVFSHTMSANQSVCLSADQINQSPRKLFWQIGQVNMLQPCTTFP